jgi:uncharacterized protein
MRVQLFSDTHGDLAALAGIAEADADLYICAGDLSNWGADLKARGRILAPLGDKLWVLPGNHESAEQIADFCAHFGFHDFHGRTFAQSGYTFAGLGYSNPTPFDTPGEYSEEELAAKLRALDTADPLVLVCHAPPLGTPLDAAGPGKHFGSRAVAEFVAERAPAYFFCGHIHEAGGVEAMLGPTRGRNLGKRGFLLELETREVQA